MLKLLLAPKQAPPAKTQSANPPDWVDTLVEKLSSAPQPTLSAEQKIVSLLEHNNDVLAELRDKLDNSPVFKVMIPTNATRLNGPPAVAVHQRPFWRNLWSNTVPPSKPNFGVIILYIY